MPIAIVGASVIVVTELRVVVVVDVAGRGVIWVPWPFSYRVVGALGAWGLRDASDHRVSKSNRAWFGPPPQALTNNLPLAMQQTNTHDQHQKSEDMAVEPGSTVSSELLASLKAYPFEQPQPQQPPQSPPAEGYPPLLFCMVSGKLRNPNAPHAVTYCTQDAWTIREYANLRGVCRAMAHDLIPRMKLRMAQVMLCVPLPAEPNFQPFLAAFMKFLRTYKPLRQDIVWYGLAPVLTEAPTDPRDWNKNFGELMRTGLGVRELLETVAHRPPRPELTGSQSPRWSRPRATSPPPPPPPAVEMGEMETDSKSDSVSEPEPEADVVMETERAPQPEPERAAVLPPRPASPVVSENAVMPPSLQFGPPPAPAAAPAPAQEPDESDTVMESAPATAAPSRKRKRETESEEERRVRLEHDRKRRKDRREAMTPEQREAERQKRRDRDRRRREKLFALPKQAVTASAAVVDRDGDAEMLSFP